ncbi:MAG: hypothetical protein ACW99G_11610 [Candidatus Thorarchaeota archaeon]|jgi:hypothetical protein
MRSSETFRPEQYELRKIGKDRWSGSGRNKVLIPTVYCPKFKYVVEVHDKCRKDDCWFYCSITFGNVLCSFGVPQKGGDEE